MINYLCQMWVECGGPDKAVLTANQENVVSWDNWREAAEDAGIEDAIARSCSFVDTWVDLIISARTKAPFLGSRHVVTLEGFHFIQCASEKWLATWPPRGTVKRARRTPAETSLLFFRGLTLTCHRLYLNEVVQPAGRLSWRFRPL
jgi:hypothetical protein